MKKAFTILVLALLLPRLQGQTLPKNDPLKLDADFYLMEKDFKKALTVYLNILKSEPDNADIKYKVGICYLNAETEKDKAIPYLQEAAEKVSEKHNPSSFKEMNAPVDALFLLGSAYRVNNQLDEAISAYQKYKNYLDPKDDYNLKVVEQYLKSCEMAKTLQHDPVTVVTTNLGNPVNTDAANYNAVISGDGKTLFYTSPARQGYDIFLATYADTGWTAPRNVTSLLATGKYMKTTDLSYDGTTLLLALDDPMNSDIFVSRFNKGRWSKAEPLGKQVNSKYNETHASLSNDGKTLYFTSDRKGGQGDMDIYKAEPDGKGDWTNTVNLGSEINTPFNEATPFIAETGDKLFFSSEGHDGIGGYDIFYYDFSNPAAGVKNLGYPINTTDNDLFYVPSGDGFTGYYAFAGKDSYGDRDIYRVSVQERIAVEEEPVLVAVEPETSTFPSEATATPDTTPALPEPELVTEVMPDTVLSITSLAEPEVAGEADADTVPAIIQNELVASLENEPQAVNPEPSVSSGPEPAAQPSVETGTYYVSDPAPAKSYRVQIMALRKPADIRNFNNISGVVVSYNNDNWYRYTLGKTADYSEAQTLLSDLISKGYGDAFIKASPVYPQYTIQIMAVPGPVVDLSRFSDLSDIFVTRGSDNFCRYSTGEFSTREEAIASLDVIRSKGYARAFVTKMP